MEEVVEIVRKANPNMSLDNILDESSKIINALEVSNIIKTINMESFNTSFDLMKRIYELVSEFDPFDYEKTICYVTEHIEDSKKLLLDPVKIICSWKDLDQKSSLRESRWCCLSVKE